MSVIEIACSCIIKKNILPNIFELLVSMADNWKYKMTDDS